MKQIIIGVLALVAAGAATARGVHPRQAQARGEMSHGFTRFYTVFSESE